MSYALSVYDFADLALICFHLIWITTDYPPVFKHGLLETPPLNQDESPTDIKSSSA